MRVPMTGGAPMTICKLSGLTRGASWGVDDTIVFATNVDQTGLFRVAAAGGTPETLTTTDTQNVRVFTNCRRFCQVAERCCSRSSESARRR